MAGFDSLKPGQTWPDLARFGKVSLTETWPNLAKIWPNLAKPGQIWPGLARFQLLPDEDEEIDDDPDEIYKEADLEFARCINLMR